MKQQRPGRRWLRGSIAVFVGFILLAATLPSTGGIIEGPARHGMWRCGPFLFYPGGFFSSVGIIGFATGCTLFGIARQNACEIVGWVLLGVSFLCL